MILLALRVGLVITLIQCRGRGGQNCWSGGGCESPSDLPPTGEQQTAGRTAKKFVRKNGLKSGKMCIPICVHSHWSPFLFIPGEFMYSCLRPDFCINESVQESFV